MSEGILPGGGMALLRASLDLDLTYLNAILVKPHQLLRVGTKYETPNDWLDLDNFWEGFNFKTEEVGDMYEMGIVDPFLVTKIALENAVSIAKTILSTDTIILDERQWS